MLILYYLRFLFYIEFDLQFIGYPGECTEDSKKTTKNAIHTSHKLLNNQLLSSSPGRAIRVSKMLSLKLKFIAMNDNFKYTLPHFDTKRDLSNASVI